MCYSNICKYGTATSAFTRVPLPRIGSNAIDVSVNTVCTTRTSSYASSVLCDFIDKCENIVATSSKISAVFITLLSVMLGAALQQSRYSRTDCNSFF